MTIPAVLPNIAVDLIFGAIIRGGTAGDKAKEAARATEIAKIMESLQALAGGDVVNGLAALQAALVTSALDPAEALAVQNFVSFATTQGAAIQQVAGGTLLGQLISTWLNNLSAEVIKVCKSYNAQA